MNFREDAHGNSMLEDGEFRVLCPLCGSPYVCHTETGDPKYIGSAHTIITDARRLLDPQTFEARPYGMVIEKAIPDFQCTAGDCGYAGFALRT